MTGSGAPAGGRHYSFRRPRSAVVERGCTKDWARSLVAQGMYPRGCIWCPGTIGDRPDIGDLFGPDPDWRSPVLILTRAEEAGTLRP